MGSKIIILDEPTGGQDYRSCLQIMDIVKDLHLKGYTIICVTHNMPLIAEYAHRVIVMGNKRVLMDGRVEAIFSRAGELEGIEAPQISRLSRLLREDLALEGDALNVAEFGETLLALNKAGL
jgi:energy-coupling factor transport system ATP-binding protein